MIELAKIRTDGGTQARAEIHEETVAEYAEAMENPETVFPPCVVYYDGKDYWLSDGFHRVAAWERAGRVEVPAEVRQGDRRRAILHSVAANSTHGLRRSNADKRRAVMTLLEDDEWSQWSNREIARRCGVSDPFVAKVREGASANGLQIPTERTVERGGVTYEQNTSNIGKAQPVEQPGAEEQEQPAAPGDEPARQPEEPVRQPDPPADPYGYAKLTEEALLDTANGLRADLDDARASVKALKAERDDFKAKWQEATADDDIGRKLGNVQRQRDTAKGRLGEEEAKNARLQRQVNAQKAEIADLKKQIENQEIAL